MTFIKLRDKNSGKDIWINTEAIDTIFSESIYTHQILTRSGVVYTINEEYYKELMETLKKL